MLYLGIDQHRKELTVCVRNEQGDAILRRRVPLACRRWEGRGGLPPKPPHAGNSGNSMTTHVPAPVHDGLPPGPADW